MCARYFLNLQFRLEVYFPPNLSSRAIFLGKPQFIQLQIDCHWLFGLAAHLQCLLISDPQSCHVLNNLQKSYYVPLSDFISGEYQIGLLFLSSQTYFWYRLGLSFWATASSKNIVNAYPFILFLNEDLRNKDRIANLLEVKALLRLMF